jgi:hypothetical protein
VEEVDMNDALLSLRRLALAVALIAGCTFAASPPAMAQSVTVVVNGQPLYLNPGPIERAGRVFVPLRAIFERLGASVVYQAGTINATKGRTTVSLQIGSTQATLNGQPEVLDVAPFIIGASTYVPLRYVAQSLGANVGYNDSTQVVSINVGGGPVVIHPVPPPVHPIPPPNPPPVSIVRLVAVQPPSGANVANRFVTISAQFSNQVAPGTVRVWLDGYDLTSRTKVSRVGFSYTPPAPLGFGGHTVRVAGLDAGGSRFDRSWSFRVIAPAPPPPPPPSPITLRAQQPAPGAAVGNRFAVISAQFSNPVVAGTVRVWLDGANRTAQCGVSSTGFSYKPPAPLDFGSHTVRVTGNGPGGGAFDRAWSFTISKPAPPARVTLTISAPGANAAVGASFTVSGNTAANASVRVTAGAGDNATGQFAKTVTAGPRGNFSATVTIRPLMGQQAVRVRITATDPVTSQTAQSVLQLRLNN